MKEFVGNLIKISASKARLPAETDDVSYDPSAKVFFILDY